MTVYVLRFRGMAGQSVVPSTDPPEGAYLERFDPEAYDGQGYAEFTTKPERAARFPSRLDAFRAWQGSPRCRPVRADGKPNKPLTAFTMSVEPIELDEEVGQ